MPEYTNKPRPSAPNLPPPPTSNPNKSVKIPRAEQINEVLSALSALETVLNSYE